MSQNEKVEFKLLEERLSHWEKLTESSGEKLYWLAKFDGDQEAAKWAFLKASEQDKLDYPSKNQKPLHPSHKTTQNAEADTRLIFRIWRGEVGFWRLWFFGSILPNILFAPLTRSLSISSSNNSDYLGRVQQGNQDVVAFLSMVVFAYSIFILLGLTRSAARMNERGRHIIEVVLAWVLVGAGWLAVVATMVLLLWLANSLIG